MSRPRASAISARDRIAQAWLASDAALVLLLEMDGTGGPGVGAGRLVGELDGERVALDARWLDCSPPTSSSASAEDDRQSVHTWLLTAAVGGPLAGRELTALRVRDGERTRQLDPGSLAPVLRPRSGLAPECRRRFDAGTCGRIAAFLRATPNARLDDLAADLRRPTPLDRLELAPGAPGDELLDAGVQLPASTGDRDPYRDTYSFALAGWALGRDGEPITVEVRERSSLIANAPARLRTPDVAARHPDVPGAVACGFQFVLGTVALPTRFELAIDAVSGGGGRVSLGRVRGRRRRLRTRHRTALQPLIVTTLGRTGSNWLMALLSRHPEVVAYRPFEAEPRVTGYWIGVLRRLAEPVSYMQSVFAQPYDEQWWLGDGRPGALPLRVAEAEMPQWLGSENVESVARFCQERIDAFYRQVASAEHGEDARYFAEKAFPGPTGPMIRELYPDGREIVLMRDLRDVVCSILEYNDKRGFSLWGRGRTASEEEWLGYLHGQAARMLESWRADAELVRYEDLISEPQATLATLFSSVGLDAGAETVARVLEEAGKVAPKAQALHLTSSSVEGSVGRWRRDLPPERQAACADAFDKILVDFGYDPTRSL